MIKFCTVIAKIYSIVICKLCLNGLRCCYFITKSARLQFFFLGHSTVCLYGLEIYHLRYSDEIFVHVKYLLQLGFTMLFG